MSNLTVVLMGLGTVFVGLICLVFLISIMNLIFRAIEKNQPVKQAAQPAVVPASDPKMDGETVAAVSAAVAETLGTDVSGIRILSIKKVN